MPTGSPLREAFAVARSDVDTSLGRAVVADERGESPAQLLTFPAHREAVLHVGLAALLTL